MVPYMTASHIDALLEHRLAYGKLKSVYELQVIEGFDHDFISVMLHFVEVRDQLGWSDLHDPEFLSDYRHELAWLSARRLELSEGYRLPGDDKRRFAGSPYRHALRYKGSFDKDVLFGFSAEKDDGENFRQSFFSTYLQLNLNRRFRQLIVGDYNAAFGQGLCFGSGLSFGKSAFVLDIMRRQNGFRPNRALNENGFLRGLACNTSLTKRLELLTFYSRKSIDATKAGEDSPPGEFGGLVNTGNYRNPDELSKRGTLMRTIAGAHLQLDLGKLDAGATVVRTILGSSPSYDQGDLYKLYGNRERHIMNYGIDYKFYHRNFLFFGEAAMNHAWPGLSFIHGLNASLDKSFDISIACRNYSKHYKPSISNAFGESAAHNNESGIYMACSVSPSRNWKFSAYADVYRFGWLRYQADAPTRGNDIMLDLQYSRRRAYSIYMRYRRDQGQQNEAGTQTMNRLGLVERHSCRWHAEIRVLPAVNLKSRLELVRHNNQFGKTARGMLMYEDLHVQVTSRFSIQARLMVFDTDDYNSRVYAYENDMAYSFSVPAFQNRGSRFYMLYKYKMKKYLHLCFRFARTSYDNADSTGSGPDMINSNKTTDTGIQILWTL